MCRSSCQPSDQARQLTHNPLARKSRRWVETATALCEFFAAVNNSRGTQYYIRDCMDGIADTLRNIAVEANALTSQPSGVGCQTYPGTPISEAAWVRRADSLTRAVSVAKGRFMTLEGPRYVRQETHMRSTRRIPICPLITGASSN